MKIMQDRNSNVQKEGRGLPPMTETERKKNLRTKRGILKPRI